MDSAAAKSFELQARVRQNAETYRNTINELYSWEKEIKDKEKELAKQRPYDDDKAKHLKTLPVRSHVQHQPEAEKAQKTNTKQSDYIEPTNTEVETPTEKVDTAPDPIALSRKEANECKDRGNMYVKLSDYENAVQEYTNAIELYADEPIFYSNRALVYLRMERFDECIEDCNQAIAIDSLCVKAYYRRMQANESLGNHMDALRDCTSVLMIEPKNAEAKRSLERINERLKKHVKSAHGPNFTPERSDLIDISPIDKPAYKRSNKPLKRIQISEIVTARDTVEKLKISDEDIDKLFNSNCGPFVEVKKGDQANAQDNAKLKSPPAKEVKQMLATPKEQTNVGDNARELQVTKSDELLAERLEDNKDVAIKSATVAVQSKRSIPPAPTSSAQFYANWKELIPEQKYAYLKSINVQELTKILGAGFSSDTLTDIINTLHDYYVPNNEPNTAATLLEVSKNNQVKILSLLMSAEDQKALSRIINSFAGNPELDATVVKRIRNNFQM